MSMTDPIADLLARIRNALMAGHQSLVVPHSKMRESIVEILRDEGFLESYSVSEGTPFSSITILLRYDEERQPVIKSMKRVSSPGRRVYSPCSEIPQVLGGLGINILSTSRGVMTGRKARTEGIGGEILCEVY